MNAFPLLSLLIALPLAASVWVALLPARAARPVALGGSLATLAAALFLVRFFDPTATGLQAVERLPWIPALGAEFHLGIDGIGIGFVLLTAALVPFVLFAFPAAWCRDRLTFSLVLALESMLLGAFVAQNFLLWFLCYELTLIPAYLLIRLRGGPGRHPASLQFLLTTQLGGVALLIGFLAVQRAAGTFDLQELARMAGSGTLHATLAATFGFAGVGTLVFALVFLGLAVKIPLLPLHTWLPPAYAEAPTPVTMLLTGALSKLGLYGLLRLWVPLFPEELAAFRPQLVLLASVTVLASAFTALVQTDLKRVLAYSSINHLGLCTLAIVATAHGESGAARAGLQGALLLAINHGLTAPALFWFVGLLEARSGGVRGIGSFGGLRAVAPVFSGTMGIALFASLGLPGLNGFPGELLLFSALVPISPWAAAAGLIGLLITAVFLLRIVHRVFHGPVPAEHAGFADLAPGERRLAFAAVGGMVVLGLWPRLITDLLVAAGKGWIG